MQRVGGAAIADGNPPAALNSLPNPTRKLDRVSSFRATSNVAAAAANVSLTHISSDVTYRMQHKISSFKSR